MSKSRVSPELHTEFARPDPAFSPVPIWWWSGEALDVERMRWQIDQLVAQGVYNAVVLNLAPTGPVHGALSDWPHMGSEAWWQIWDDLCTHSLRVGMRLWFYDQFGFSGANLQGQLVIATPSFVGMSIERIVIDVTSQGEVTCPEAGIAIAAHSLPLDDAGGVCGAPVAIEIRDGIARWTGAGRARLMLAYALQKGFDYHSPEACAALIDTVHGAFERRLGKYFGSALVGSFQDELPSVPNWSDRFEREFVRRAGYPIAAKLAALWEDWGLESARVRADYQRVRAALAEEALFRPLFEWHDSRGLVFGVDQQSPARAAEPLGATDQYADYARTHRWYSAPGSDHWGDAKFHSSLAHSYGRPRTWIESFHSSGWGGTLEETFDWLQPWLLAGANLYDPHAVYYSTKGGQWEWAAPSTCWRQPYWRHYKHFADAISRLCWAATQGEHVCDIGVLYPSAAVQADMFLDHAGQKGRAAHRSYMELVGSMIWFNSRKGALARLRRDFDVLDDDTVADAAVTGCELATHGERYKALIVPNVWLIETPTLEKLVEFAEAGGLLIVLEALPDATDKQQGGAALARLRQLAEEGRVIVIRGGDALRANLEDVLAALPAEIIGASPTLLRRDGNLNLLFVTAASEGQATAQPMLPWATWHYDQDVFPMARYSSELRAKGYDFQPSRNASKANVTIAGPVGVIEQWDPSTGEAQAVEVVRRGGVTEVTVDFRQSPFSILVWSSSGHGADVAVLEARRAAERILPDTWRSRLVPTMDNRYGDFSLPASAGPLPVQTWVLDHREDLAERPDPDWQHDSWGRVPVTEGLRAWQFGPAPKSAMPSPLSGIGTLQAAGWSPVNFSLSRGIDRDPVHDRTLGPKGRVPEEFWRVRKVAAGEFVQLRTALPAPAGPLTLAIGANGRKTVWWNGQQMPEDVGGYLSMCPVSSTGANNLLEVRVEALADDDLAGYWALTTDRGAFERPEWLRPGDDARPGSLFVVSRQVEVSAGDEFEAHFASQGVATLIVNGREVAMHGAFDPYARWQMVRIIAYRLTDYLRPGSNLIEVRFTDIGKPLAMLFDGILRSGSGATRNITSDMNWQGARDGLPAPVDLQSGQRNDPRYALLRPRPHPLPRSGWLDPGQPMAGVLDIVPEPRPGLPKSHQWFRVALPPGTSGIHLPTNAADVVVFVDGEVLPIERGHLDLPRPAARWQSVLVRINTGDGRSGGAVWDGPIAFDVEGGEIGLGPWSEAGLEFYSGGLAYEQTLVIDHPDEWTELDLGTVRGTAEVEVNGRPAGVRVWSPYRFAIDGLLQRGENVLTVRVFNTLAPYLKGVSPTRTIFKGQDVSGIMGPVTLR